MNWFFALIVVFFIVDICIIASAFPHDSDKAHIFVQIHFAKSWPTILVVLVLLHDCELSERFAVY